MFFLEYIANYLVAFLLFMTNIGGLSGGGVIMPTSALFYKFNSVNSISLSNCSIFFSGLVRFLMNFHQKHPKKHWATLIDYDVVMIMMPFCIIGSAIGIILNVMIPQLIIVIIMVVTLFFILVGNLVKTVTIFKLE